MNMRTYMNKLSEAERKNFARLAGTSVGYLWQIAGQHRIPSPNLAKKLEEASQGILNKVTLCFPELENDEDS